MENYSPFFLPVLHLIGTRRSTPYANKQIQELLGVSCAFGQAVQLHPVHEVNILLLVVDPGVISCGTRERIESRGWTRCFQLSAYGDHNKWRRSNYGSTGGRS
ncbi:hypothetical protein ACFX13_031723 [Malus domestica]